MRDAGGAQMKKALTALALAMLLLASYLAAWPVPVEPMAWQPPTATGYAGVHAPNERLSRMQHIDLKGERGPEHIALGPDGKLYTAVASGKVLRMNPDGSGMETFAQSPGRILGFDFDSQGHLIGADAMRGLVSVARDGQVTVLADKVDGDPIRFADAVAVARNGKIYFSDASTRFPAAVFGIEEASLLEVLEQSASGRVLEYDPATKKVRTIAGGFSFANGVALSQDEGALYVSDTGRFRIWQIDVTGASPPKVILDDLPGYPDNLTRARDGEIWVGLFGPRSADADKLSDRPFLRKVIMRLPRALWPLPKHFGHVFSFNAAGQIVADLQDPAGIQLNTTGATETPDRIYVQSLSARTIGWLPRP
jgi:sugar lactone lactonase YvrE